MRTRKLIGAVGLVALVIFWPLLTLALGHSNLSRFYAPAQFIFFIVFGLIWLVPAAWLIRWMQRPDPKADTDQAALEPASSRDSTNGNPDNSTST